jgi:hypothetical protein
MNRWIMAPLAIAILLSGCAEHSVRMQELGHPLGRGTLSYQAGALGVGNWTVDSVRVEVQEPSVAGLPGYFTWIVFEVGDGAGPPLARVAFNCNIPERPDSVLVFPVGPFPVTGFLEPNRCTGRVSLGDGTGARSEGTFLRGELHVLFMGDRTHVRGQASANLLGEGGRFPDVPEAGFEVAGVGRVVRP